MREYHNKSTLQESYSKYNSLKKVAEEFGVSATTIRKWMKRHGIERNYRQNSKEKLEVECAQCGNNLEVPPHKKDQENHFCDKKCYSVWQSKYDSIKEHSHSEGSHQSYGHNWTEIQSKVRKRDNNTCQYCNTPKEELNRSPSCHHIKPRSSFNTKEDANYMENLVLVCNSCHMKVESISEERQREIFAL